MKKFGVYVIIIIIVIVGAIFLKNITTTKYSHADIANLINKGKKTMEDMENTNNLYYEKENKGVTTKYYFKKGKKKMVSQDNNNIAISLGDGKMYNMNNTTKNMFIFTGEDYLISNALQENALQIEEFNNNSINKDRLMYEFVYIRDEKIENKDCILVKEGVFNLKTKEYSDYYNDKKETAVYWIEKSTGFVLGGAFMEFGNNKPTPQTIIKNIKFEEIEDDVFELPNDYNVFRMEDNGEVVKIK